MRQSEHTLTSVCLPLTNRLRQVALHLFPQMPFLRISPNQQRHLHICKRFEQFASPCLRAPFHRRNVAARLVIARKTKAHRHNRNPAFIIECVLIHTHPVAQTHPRRVRKWPPAFHRQISRRLARDKNGRSVRHRKYGPGRHAHIRLAKLAGAYLSS